MDEQIKLLIEKGDEALKNGDYILAKSYYAEAVSLGSKEAFEKLKEVELILTGKKISTDNFVETIPSNFKSVGNLLFLSIVGIIIQFVLLMAAITSDKPDKGGAIVGLIFAIVISIVFASTISDINKLTSAVHNLQEKTKDKSPK